MGIALIWFAPMLEQQWDVKTGVQQSFDNTLRALAEVSGYDEIATSLLYRSVIRHKQPCHGISPHGIRTEPYV